MKKKKKKKKKKKREKNGDAENVLCAKYLATSIVWWPSIRSFVVFPSFLFMFGHILTLISQLPLRKQPGSVDFFLHAFILLFSLLLKFFFFFLHSRVLRRLSNGKKTSVDQSVRVSSSGGTDWNWRLIIWSRVGWQVVSAINSWNGSNLSGTFQTRRASHFLCRLIYQTQPSPTSQSLPPSSSARFILFTIELPTRSLTRR